MFEGRVTPIDGDYIVDFADGRIRVKAQEVDLVCNSLEDGYRKKLSAVQVDNVQSHLELAQWCMKHKLMKLAAIELANATMIDPSYPAIAALQNRLTLAQESPAPNVPMDRPKLGPSNDELDRMVRSLPRNVVETFTQSVQPVLMNHCASGGCHSPESKTELRIFRVSAGKAASRRVTQRNLYSVLPLMDRDNPTASRLLTVPNAPHGTAKQRIFGEHEVVQYKRMVDWAVQLAGHSAPETPATVRREPAIEPTSPASVEAPPQVLPQDARKARPLPAHSQPANIKRGAASTAAKSAEKNTSADRPADPFDPEVFNRRFAPKKASDKEPPAKTPDGEGDATAKRP
jgi:hypothetical protein